jgi:PAS domain S-box-containing protein
VSKAEYASQSAGGDELASLVRFQELALERSHDLITVTDSTGRIVYASPSWQTRLGWDLDLVIGTPSTEFVHPDEMSMAKEAFRSVTAGQAIESAPARVRAADGGWVTFDFSLAPLSDPVSSETYVVASARDITEREALRERVLEIDVLYRVADAVARAPSLAVLFEESIDLLIDATGVDRAAALLADEDVMRFQSWRGLSDGYRAAAEGHSPWGPDAPNPKPVLVADITDAGFAPELEAAIRAEGIAALAFIPLLHDGNLLGKFMLYRDAPHLWSDREVRLAQTIASHLASATVRTRAREALRDSRVQLETIMRTVDEGIVVQTRGGRLVYANDAAVRAIGFASTDELLSSERRETLSRFELLDEEGRPMQADELPGRRALEGETSERTIRYRIKETGEERWSVVRANPVYDTDGRVTMAVSVIRDITGTRTAAERQSFLTRGSELLNETLAIQQTLAALAELAVPAFAGHVTVDLYEDGVLRCVGARHLDPAKSEMMLELREKYPPTVEAHPVQRAIRTGEPQFVPDVQAEAVSMAHDEEHAQAIRQLENTSGIVIPLIARGRTFGAITFGTVLPQPPFTEADFALAIELGRRAAIALDNALLYGEAEARAHAAEALEFVDDGVFLVDGEGVIRLWNAAAVKTFRVKASKAVGKQVEEVIRDWPSIVDRITPAAEPTAGLRSPETFPLVVKGVERWLSISAVLFPGGTVYAFRDLTEERAVEQLKSDFVSTVSHELRTPLAAIYGAALTLQRDDVRLEESQRTGLLDVISSEADRLARIVNDILWASRLDSGQMGVAIESCDAAKLAQQVIDALRHHAPTTVELRVDAAEQLPPVAADPDKLRQVLTNLVDNAVKYSPDGGTVHLSVQPTANRIRFRVDDEGLGVPPAEQSRIFEKFFRLDPQLTRGVGGTGLGLYICRELVQRMHGRIWVASDGRRGSTFTVELPIAVE